MSQTALPGRLGIEEGLRRAEIGLPNGSGRLAVAVPCGRLGRLQVKPTQTPFVPEEELVTLRMEPVGPEGLDPEAREIHVAVVHGPWEIRLVAVGGSESELMRRLASRLLQEAEIQLWDRDAMNFRRLVAAARSTEAIQFYFAHVGERWDTQRLSVYQFDPRGDVSSPVECW